MSAEISLTGTFTVSPSGMEPFERTISVSVDQTGAKLVSNTLAVLTSATAIPLGGVTTPHWAWFKNTDATNYIKIGLTGSYFVRLYPGKECVIPVDPGATPYAIADTATCQLNYMIAQQ